MGLFSGSKSYATSTSQQTDVGASDARIGVEGGAGQVVGARATVANPASAATSVGDFSQLTQTITGNEFRAGLSGEEVKGLVMSVQEGAQKTSAAISDFGGKAISALSQATTGQGTDLARYAPYAVVLLIAIAAIKAGAGARA